MKIIIHKNYASLVGEGLEVISTSNYSSSSKAAIASLCNIDKRALGKIIFQRKYLNRHPFIKDDFVCLFKEFMQKARV